MEAVLHPRVGRTPGDAVALTHNHLQATLHHVKAVPRNAALRCFTTAYQQCNMLKNSLYRAWLQRVG